MDENLVALLHRLRLSHLEPAFAAEELTLPLLRSMGHQALRSNLLEVDGVSASDAPRLAEAIHAADVSPKTEPQAARQPAKRPGGTLRIKWQGRELSFAFGEASTVDDLRSWLAERTGVAAEQQKLAGLASQRRQPSGGDLLAGLNVGHRPLLLLGTPSAELRKAEAELEEGRRAAAKIRSDLTEPSCRRRSPQRTRVRRAADPRAIAADRGGGIYLDPAVWAPEVGEDSRGPAFSGTAQERYVSNPRTGRLEPLTLGNALVGTSDSVAAGERVQQPLRPEHAPPNVDLMGVVAARARAARAAPASSGCSGTQRMKTTWTSCAAPDAAVKACTTRRFDDA
eukprot:CAMPEP_0185331908 /NCGR_PEP_ID=MMETSP1363-20130426/80280_1 /TAXON_ID=38817 /ORGANISM="Gephyrocapsa oceanica, Strain RCC1303" /LENGTH=339 /DNA_ID=CAMNT_0027930807 /DNA_START=67 /DNA_END=1087 /DNA_ORIENTATION=-